MRNVALLEQTMQEILDDPNHWDQAQWICGTKACYAGRVALDLGWTLVQDPENVFVLTPFGTSVLVQKDGQEENVREIARQALGLDDEEATLLFAPSHDLEELQLVVKGLINGETVDDIEGALDG